MSSDNLIENNIFQHIATPLQNEDSLGTVQAYNFTLDDYYTKGGAYAWQQGSAYHHGAGDQYHLFEGNQGIGLSADAIHGTADFITAFRNYWTGLDAAPGGSTIKTQQTTPVILRSEEHTSELQSQSNLVCRLLLEKKKTNIKYGLLPCTSAEPKRYYCICCFGWLCGPRSDRFRLCLSAKQVMCCSPCSGIYLTSTS